MNKLLIYLVLGFFFLGCAAEMEDITEEYKQLENNLQGDYDQKVHQRVEVKICVERENEDTENDC